jgi:hypothetical protein
MVVVVVVVAMAFLLGCADALTNRRVVLARRRFRRNGMRSMHNDDGDCGVFARARAVDHDEDDGD